MGSAFRAHWPEYLIEAGCLATVMLSAAGFARLLGMGLAAALYVRQRGLAQVLCAKFDHGSGPCIFRCRFGMAAEPMSVDVPTAREVSA